MVKTRKIIRQNLSLVDTVIHLLDARAPYSTYIPDLKSLTSGKPVILALNKADLADEQITNAWLDAFEKNKIPAIALDTLKRRGFQRLHVLLKKNNRKKSRAIRCMVVGVPNVGKSALLNQLALRKAAKTGNRPGVTKGKMWLKTKEGMELLDTPGILWPKFEEEIIGVNLALLGSIRQEILNQEKLSYHLIDFLKEKYPSKLKLRYKINIEQLPASKILIQIAKNRGFLISGGSYDIERAANTLLLEFQQGRLGPISLETPKGKEGFWEKI